MCTPSVSRFPCMAVLHLYWPRRSRTDGGAPHCNPGLQFGASLPASVSDRGGLAASPPSVPDRRLGPRALVPDRSRGAAVVPPCTLLQVVESVIR